MPIPLITRNSLRRIGILFIIIIILCPICWWFMIRMPGKSWPGPLPPLTQKEADMAKELREVVEHLANRIGERNVSRRYEALRKTAEYLDSSLEKIGFRVQRQAFQADGKSCENVEGEILGSKAPDKIIVVGAHYDTVPGSPGANDNGSAAASTLCLAREFFNTTPKKTIRFVFFVNEEPPHFQTSEMGSLVYAKSCRERGEDIEAMFSLETMGCYFEEKDTQRYPPPLSLVYPSTGNFIAFVGNMGSRDLVRKTIGLFRKKVSFPSVGGALPGFIPGVGWSDHWSFWKAGYAGVMVTDTAPFRYPYYHLASDTPDKVNYEKLARVTNGLKKVLEEFIN